MSHGKDNHDDHDEHDGKGLYRMRATSPLSAEAERAMTLVIDRAIAVHRELGPGFLESIYKKAMCIALSKADVRYECEKAVHVMYDGVPITGQRIDLIVEGVIVVELKSVSHLDGIHEAQLISYLRTTGLRGGLLINFRVPLLYRGIKRVVL
jgi:GxxExxY protein